MQPSRRDICRAGVAGVFAVGLACEGGAQPRTVPGGVSLPDSALGARAYALSLATFSPLVGTRFQLSGGDARAELTLTRATDLGIAGRPVVDKAECFELTFEGTAGAFLGQDTYVVSHAVLGSFPMFIVPGRTSSPQTYSALFNRV